MITTDIRIERKSTELRSFKVVCFVAFHISIHIKMRMYFYALISALLILGTTTEAAKIFVLQALPSKSHIVAYQPLFEELARRGHEVTYVSAFPKNTKLANYTEIKLEDTFPPKDSNQLNFFSIRNIPFFILMFFMRPILLDSCEKVLMQPEMQKLIHSTDLEFDLIIYEPFMTQCTYGFIHKFKAPSIQIITNTVMEWMTDPVGNPNTMSYVPSAHSDSEDMTFLSRVSNFLVGNYLRIFYKFLIEPQMDSIMRKHFPDPTIPSFQEMEKNASLLFLHSHPLLNHPRPLTPNTIEVGGIHIKATQNLPQDLKKFLDEAPYGVIYFSLGSNVRSVDMPETMRNALLKSFSKLKERVLWKWESDTLPDQPKNVHVSKWLPQHDILAHPNVKLFITHGGLMSLQEAVYFGVPVIAIPVAADQRFNADVARNRGLGVVLDIQNITEASLDWTLNEVLHGPRYHEAAKQVSRIFQDQPQTPLDRAVYWIEYTIRHKGAVHMRSAALDLNVFQYYLLDVIAFLLLVSVLSVFSTWLAFRYVCSRRSEHSKKKTSEKKNN